MLLQLFSSEPSGHWIVPLQTQTLGMHVPSRQLNSGHGVVRRGVVVDVVVVVVVGAVVVGAVKLGQPYNSNRKHGLRSNSWISMRTYLACIFFSSFDVVI